MDAKRLPNTRNRFSNCKWVRCFPWTKSVKIISYYYNNTSTVLFKVHLNPSILITRGQKLGIVVHTETSNSTVKFKKGNSYKNYKF
jgi:hypothetical protein